MRRISLGAGDPAGDSRAAEARPYESTDACNAFDLPLTACGCSPLRRRGSAGAKADALGAGHRGRAGVRG